MVAQQQGPVAAETLGDAGASVQALHLHFLVFEQRRVLEEDAGFLGDRLDLSRLGAERRPPLRVRVGGAHHIGAGGEDRLVDVEARPVDVAGSFHELAIGPHQDQVVRRRRRERDAVAKHPEAVAAFRVATADVSIAEVTPAEGAEDSVAAGQVLPQGRLFVGHGDWVPCCMADSAGAGGELLGACRKWLPWNFGPMYGNAASLR